jgi:hypothetical protein
MPRPTRYPLRILLKNGPSMIGLVLFCSGLISAIVLLAADLFKPFHNPYVNILSYFLAPTVMFAGISLTIGGVIRQVRRLRRGVDLSLLPVIDLNDRRQFARLASVMGGGFGFMVISAVGAYQAYHFTESVEFCGTTCHQVMKPEYTAYHASPHANVSCVECHIGPGAGWFVKSKLDGLYQVYSTTFDKYDRPIPAPLHNLRPADQTCNECHWPSKFFGAVEQVRTYTLPDKSNTPWTVRMLINVGGGDPRHGPAHGIHLHMAVGNKVDYIAADQKRLDIPWVRVTDKEGKVTIYRDRKKGAEYTDEKVAASEVRRMDCMDCHNRASHRYRSPNDTLDTALAVGLIDRSIPWIKKNGVKALTGEYKTEAEALSGIEAVLKEAYPEGGERVEKAIREVQGIYSVNFFPEMKVNWREYPDHIGHKITRGCFRCHGDHHVSDDGRTLQLSCNECHSIIAQGQGTKLPSVTSEGLEFEHPEDIGDEWKETPCSDCHEGVPVG